MLLAMWRQEPDCWDLHDYQSSRQSTTESGQASWMAVKQGGTICILPMLQLAALDIDDDLQALAVEKAAFLGGLGNAEVPFPKLVEALDVPRSPMHTPIFQAIVAINETVSATCDTLKATEVLAVVCSFPSWSEVT